MIEFLVLGIALYGLIVFFRQSSLFKPNNINWNALESIGVAVFIYFFSQIGLVIFLTLIASSSGNYDGVIKWFSKNNYGVFVSILLTQAITLLLVLGFLKNRKSSLAKIGLSRNPQVKDFLYAVVGAVGYFTVFIFIITIVTNLIPSINVDQKQELGFDNVARSELPIVFMSLVILPPIMEEITTRGLLYSGLKNNLAIPKAALITSILFAIAHLQHGSGNPLLWVAAIDTFILSFFLVYLREKTGSLWSPIYLHGIKNFIAFMSLFVWRIA